MARFDQPAGPLRDKFTQTIGSDDFEPGYNFVCAVATAGNLVYRTATGTADQTESSLSAGDVIAAAGVPVLLKTIKGTSTVTSVIVGVQ